MLKEIHSTNQPTLPARLSQFEHRWGLTLPESYRTFLLRNNGGIPEQSIFPIHVMTDNPTEEIQVFFGLGPKIESSGLDWNLENLGVRQPDGLLPIACTGSSDLICLATKHEGRILFLDRLACWDKDQCEDVDFYPVADSFDDLLSKLEASEPGSTRG